MITMVFCYQNCSDLLWKKEDREKILKFEAEDREFEITRTICSNSKRSEQFLVRECFFSLIMEVSPPFFISDKLEQLGFKFEKILGFRNMQKKFRK